MLFDVQHVSPCFEYRGRRADETPEAYGARLAAELEAKIIELGPRNVAAFIAETVVGATLGAATAVPGYFKRVREVCDRHGVLLILDEVMSGMGRTGTLHACEQEGIAPDLMAIAKGLGGGFAPIGAMLVSSTYPLRSAPARAPSRTARPTSATRSPAPPASPCRRSSRATTCSPMCASRATTWSGGCARASPTTTTSAISAAAACSAASRSSRTAPARSRSIRAQAACPHQADRHGPRPDGLSDGRHRRRQGGDHILLAPPFIVTERDIDQIVDILGVVIDKSIAAAR